MIHPVIRLLQGSAGHRATVLLVRSVGFMLLIERFLKAETLVKIG